MLFHKNTKKIEKIFCSIKTHAISTPIQVNGLHIQHGLVRYDITVRDALHVCHGKGAAKATVPGRVHLAVLLRTPR